MEQVIEAEGGVEDIVAGAVECVSKPEERFREREGGVRGEEEEGEGDGLKADPQRGMSNWRQ